MTYKREKNLHMKEEFAIKTASGKCAFTISRDENAIFFPLADTWNFKIRKRDAFAIWWKTCWRVLIVAIKSQRSDRLRTDKWARGRDARQTYGLHKKKKKRDRWSAVDPKLMETKHRTFCVVAVPAVCTHWRSPLCFCYNMCTHPL